MKSDMVESERRRNKRIKKSRKHSTWKDETVSYVGFVRDIAKLSIHAYFLVRSILLATT